MPSFESTTHSWVIPASEGAKMVKLGNGKQTDTPTPSANPDVDLENEYVPSQGLKTVMEMGMLFRRMLASQGVVLSDATTFFTGYYQFIHSAFQSSDVREVHVSFVVNAPAPGNEGTEISTQFAIHRVLDSGERKMFMSQDHSIQLDTPIGETATDGVEQPKVLE